MAGNGGIGLFCHGEGILVPCRPGLRVGGALAVNNNIIQAGEVTNPLGVEDFPPFPLVLQGGHLSNPPV